VWPTYSGILVSGSDVQYGCTERLGVQYGLAVLLWYKYRWEQVSVYVDNKDRDIRQTRVTTVPNTGTYLQTNDINNKNPIKRLPSQ